MTPATAYARLRQTAVVKCLRPRYRLETMVRRFALECRLARAKMNDLLAPRLELPLPPPRLRHRVHGLLDASSFLSTGRRCAEDILAVLASVGMVRPLRGRVLDFGCGCGRTMRHFYDAAGVELWGTDIDQEAIRWCQSAFPRASFRMNPRLPPAPFPSSFFDLIYGISVFTHLDEVYQFTWLEELRRMCKPEGIVVLTVHGRSCYPSGLPDAESRILEERGFLFRVGATGWAKLDGLPDFYQNSYHSERYVRREWSRVFPVLAHVERGMNDQQDVVVLGAGRP